MFVGDISFRFTTRTRRKCDLSSLIQVSSRLGCPKASCLRVVFPPALLLKYLYSEWSKTTHEHIKILSQERVVLSVTKSRKPIKLSLLCSYYEVLNKTVYVVDDILSSHNTESFKYDPSLVYWVYIMKSWIKLFMHWTIFSSHNTESFQYDAQAKKIIV